MRERISVIWTTPKDELEKLINESSSLSEVLRKMGYVNIEGNHRTIKDRIEKEKIDITALLERGKLIKFNRLKNLHNASRIDDKDVFKENSNFSRNHLKERIIKEKLIPYKCKECNNEGMWNNKELSLHLEHMNGIGNDNRLENLCFLCPNCHSQTLTYAGKNVKLKRPLPIKRTCPMCGKEKDRQSEVCRDCYRKSK